MSTALVSAFYDFSDVVYQNQKNRAQLQNMQKMESSRVVGSPVNLSPRNRSSPILGTAIMGSKPSPPPSPTEMISYDDATHQQVLQYAELLSQLPHRKLDRSVSESSVQSDRNNANKNINSTRYKTEMCRPFEENGHCKYGDKCQFAHGGNELRSLNRHPKYKTEFCRTFHTKGFCPYGPRCHFIHSENEGKLSEINQVKTEQQIQHQLLAAQATHLLNTATYSHVPTSPSHPHHFAQPIPARPKQLPFSLSMPIGSTADSPASSVSGDSPTLSPTSFQWNAHESNDVFSPVPVQSAPPTGLSNSFTFQDIQLVLEQLSAQQQQQQQQQQVIPQPQPSQCSPLNVQTSPRHMSNEARLQQFLNQQNQRNNNCLRDSFGSTASIGSSSDSLYSAPSPKSAASFPESQSTCGSPLDISRSLRLPIFKDMC